jgi:crossover junction endodeoxyribonuclease RuvC
MKVLAIDPGFDRLGLAIVEGNPSKPTVVWSDCVIPPKGEVHERLGVVFNAVQKAIQKFKPDVLALESLFFSKNVKTALGVAEARGAVLSAAGMVGLRVVECSPQQVKLAVTGYGAADKKAVERMIPKLVTLTPKKRLDDELDAIALGICALPQASASRYPQTRKK